jgi:hypothetical protein
MNDMSNFTPELPKQTGNGTTPEITLQYRLSVYFDDVDGAPDQHFAGILVTAPATRFHEFLAGPFATQAEATAALAEITDDPRGIFPASLGFCTAVGLGGNPDTHHIGVSWVDGANSHFHRLLGPYPSAEAAEIAMDKLMTPAANDREAGHD